MNYWFVHDVLTEKKRKSLVSFIKKNNDGWEDKTNGAVDNLGNTLKYSDTYKIRFDKIKPFLGDIPSIIKHINLEQFGYDCDKLDTDFVIMNTYTGHPTEGHYYGWHTDGSRSPTFDTKISVLINLSKSYEGGDLYIFQGNEHRVSELKPRSMVMLKSFVPHRVARVTKGERITLTLFLNGPKFR